VAPNLVGERAGAGENIEQRSRKRLRLLTDFFIKGYILLSK
jgi:hypothetical protein